MGGNRTGIATAARAVVAVAIAAVGLVGIWAVFRPFQPGPDRLTVTFDEVPYGAMIGLDVDGRRLTSAPAPSGGQWAQTLTITPIAAVGESGGGVRFIWDAAAEAPPAGWTIERDAGPARVLGVPGVSGPFPISFGDGPTLALPFAVGPGNGRALVEGPGGAVVVDLSTPTPSGFREVVLDARRLTRGPATAVIDVPVDAARVRLYPSSVAGRVVVRRAVVTGSREVALRLADAPVGPGLTRIDATAFDVVSPGAAYIDVPPLPPPPMLHAGNVRVLLAAAVSSLLAILGAFAVGRLRRPLLVATGMTVVGLIAAGAVAARLADDVPGGAPLAVVIADDATLVAVGRATTDAAATFAVLPDDSILVGGKGGFGGEADAWIERLPAGGGPAVRIGSLRVCTEAERGLLGLEASRSFATDRVVYAFRTAAAAACGTGRAPGTAPTNEVLRLTLAPDLGSIVREEVIATGIPSYTAAHNAGGLRLAEDGALYVSIGDSGDGALSREPGSVLARIVRIPADRLAGGAPIVAAELASMTFAVGFRNPFRFALLDAQHLLVNDVGSAPPSAAEEVNLVVEGGDYGWPYFEGPSSDDRFAAPLWSYPHNDGCASTTGGTIGMQGAFGARGRPYVFGDFTCGRLYVLDLDGTHPRELTRIRDLDPQLLPAEFRTTADGRVVVLGFGGTVYEIRR